MPESVIVSASGEKVMRPHANFTGDVLLDMLHKDSSVAMANVTFTPCARTHWHTHDGGQVIRVLHGAGWICDNGGEARRIKAGDTIWAPPGTTHWHGADDDSVMTHFVVGIGATNWHGAVTDEDFKKRTKE
jgi:quercetin dioxygenase-like cupin family protein